MLKSAVEKVYVGLARTLYIQCIYGIFGREITKYTVIYGAYIRFWPTLCICKKCARSCSWKSVLNPASACLGWIDYCLPHINNSDLARNNTSKEKEMDHTLLSYL
jgi:hypothetical protein